MHDQREISQHVNYENRGDRLVIRSRPANAKYMATVSGLIALMSGAAAAGLILLMIINALLYTDDTFRDLPGSLATIGIALMVAGIPALMCITTIKWFLWFTQGIETITVSSEGITRWLHAPWTKIQQKSGIDSASDLRLASLNDTGTQKTPKFFHTHGMIAYGPWSAVGFLGRDMTKQDAERVIDCIQKFVNEQSPAQPAP